MPTVGPQELLIVGVLLLLLVNFGSDNFGNTAREVSHFLGGAKRTVEDAKSELLPEEVKEARRAIKDFNSEALYGAQRENEPRKP
jgi:Sec-independent protein translocase protein TatA